MSKAGASIRYLERGTVFRPRSPAIVNARGADVRVTKPFLHLGNVGLVVERVGRGRCSQCMGADLKPSAAE